LFIFLILLSIRGTAQDIPTELILRAYNYCYPGRTGQPAFQDGDWTIRAGKETYYWAGGRLLPAGLREKAYSYSPFSFEIYPDTVPLPSIFPAQYIEALRLYGGAEARRSEEDQYRGFQGALYGGLSRREIEAQLRGIEFLGKKISVHSDIVQALRRIGTVIQKAAVQDSAEGKEIAVFLESIGQIGGYNWREIRGSRRMSHHSWGLALDIQPKKLNGKAIYWLWERPRNDKWMLVPLETRWMPPDPVIKAFENEGFVWGGKWALYDNMHFEYRPELHEIKRLLASGGEAYSVSGGSTHSASPDLHHIYPDGLGE
jgi:hypothetical protein